MGNALFVDISSWNNPALVNWPVYKAWSASGDGISRVLLRDDQGVGVPDSAFEQFWAGATGVGIDEIFVYHYAYPNLHPGPAGAVAEAQSMEQVVGHRLRTNDKVMLDLEQNESGAWAIAFGQQMQLWHPTASKPALYDSLSHIQQFLTDPALPTIYDLALADWTFDPNSRPQAPAPWPGYVWLQFSDRLSVPGMPGSLDANVFLGGVPVPLGPFYDVKIGTTPGLPNGTTLTQIADALGISVASLKAIQPKRWADNYDPNFPGAIDGQQVTVPGWQQPAPPPTGTAELVIDKTSIRAVIV